MLERGGGGVFMVSWFNLNIHTVLLESFLSGDKPKTKQDKVFPINPTKIITGNPIRISIRMAPRRYSPSF